MQKMYYIYMNITIQREREINDYVHKQFYVSISSAGSCRRPFKMLKRHVHFVCCYCCCYCCCCSRLYICQRVVKKTFRILEPDPCKA